MAEVRAADAPLCPPWSSGLGVGGVSCSQFSAFKLPTSWAPMCTGPPLFGSRSRGSGRAGSLGPRQRARPLQGAGAWLGQSERSMVPGPPAEGGSRPPLGCQHLGLPGSPVSCVLSTANEARGREPEGGHAGRRREGDGDLSAGRGGTGTALRLRPRPGAQPHGAAPPRQAARPLLPAVPHPHPHPAPHSTPHA